MKRRLKTRKIPKVYSPLDLHKRIDVWHDNEKGNAGCYKKCPETAISISALREEIE